jgi:hypothetical protein
MQTALIYDTLGKHNCHFTQTSQVASQNIYKKIKSTETEKLDKGNHMSSESTRNRSSLFQNCMVKDRSFFYLSPCVDKVDKIYLLKM